MHVMLQPYIPRVSREIQDLRWRQFLFLIFFVMQNHMVFTVQQAMPAVSYRVLLMNSAGVVLVNAGTDTNEKEYSAHCTFLKLNV
jgi:hypothetical protein